MSSTIIKEWGERAKTAGYQEEKLVKNNKLPEDVLNKWGNKEKL